MVTILENEWVLISEFGKPDESGTYLIWGNKKSFLQLDYYDAKSELFNIEQYGVEVFFWMDKPSAPDNQYWCAVCEDTHIDIQYCMNPPDCECSPYHSKESGTIEEKVCDYCLERSKLNEIPF